MPFGEIIKKSWRITWRYRALWVLGLFAGITGGSVSGGSSGRGYNTGSSSSSSAPFSDLHPQQWLAALERILPILIVTAVGLFVIGFVWWILSIAARGGLIYAVNEIEAGRPFSLGASWSAGFSRFWSLLGLSILLSLPLLLLGLALFFAILGPLVLPLLRGSQPGVGAVVPICGAIAIGLPLLIVGGIVLGVMHILGNRYLMLGGVGVIEAARQGWRAVRGRFKDTALMYLISVGLNIAAGLALAIPIVILFLVVGGPALVAGIAGRWAMVAAATAVGLFLLIAISLVFTAIWGTFTSALWTIFFRKLTGMEPAAVVPAPPAAPAPPMAPPPAGPAVLQPPLAPPMAPPPPPPSATAPLSAAPDA